MSSSEVIEVEHFYSHPPAALWKALTTPELHARWSTPGSVRTEVGHKFDLDMGNWGKQSCEVLAVELERLICYVFAAGVLENSSHMMYLEEPGRALVSLVQFALPLASEKSASNGERP